MRCTYAIPPLSRVIHHRIRHAPCSLPRARAQCIRVSISPVVCLTMICAGKVTFLELLAGKWTVLPGMTTAVARRALHVVILIPTCPSLSRRDPLGQHTVRTYRYTRFDRMRDAHVVSWPRHATVSGLSPGGGLRVCVYVCTQLCCVAEDAGYIEQLESCRVRIHTYMHACIHTYIHTYMHACIHMTAFSMHALGP